MLVIVFFLNLTPNHPIMRNQCFNPACFCFLFFALLIACKEKGPADKRISQLDSLENANMARAIESGVSTTLADGLAIRLWAVDSLVADPVSLDIDDFGRLFYTRTNRQKNSEFDI